MGGPGQAERALSICRTEFHLEARTIELCILQVLRGALLHQARRTVDEILLFDHQRPTPSPRPGNCTLLYRVGQAVKVGGELGVIVGWAEQSSRQTVGKSFFPFTRCNELTKSLQPSQDSDVEVAAVRSLPLLSLYTFAHRRLCTGW